MENVGLRGMWLDDAARGIRPPANVRLSAVQLYLTTTLRKLRAQLHNKWREFINFSFFEANRLCLLPHRSQRFTR
jgi:hypothetical protein